MGRYDSPLMYNIYNLLEAFLSTSIMEGSSIVKGAISVFESIVPSTDCQLYDEELNDIQEKLDLEI
jgi:hypothetical protein